MDFRSPSKLDIAHSFILKRIEQTPEAFKKHLSTAVLNDKGKKTLYSRDCCHWTSLALGPRMGLFRKEVHFALKHGSRTGDWNRLHYLNLFQLELSCCMATRILVFMHTICTKWSVGWVPFVKVNQSMHGLVEPSIPEVHVHCLLLITKRGAV